MKKTFAKLQKNEKSVKKSKIEKKIEKVKDLEFIYETHYDQTIDILFPKDLYNLQEVLEVGNNSTSSFDSFTGL